MEQMWPCGQDGNGRLHKEVIFGELRKTRPSHGAKRVMRGDVHGIGVGGDKWYELC